MKENIINEKSRFIPHANALIKGYNQLNSIWSRVLTVAGEMDGKVFNKRFTDAVNARIEEYGHVTISDTFGSGRKILKIWLKERSYKGADCRGFECWIYFDDELYFDYLYNIDDMLTDGRIDATKAAKVIGDFFRLIAEKVATLKDAVKNYDKYMAKRAKALAAFGKAMAEVNKLFEFDSLHRYDWQKAAEIKE